MAEALLLTPYFQTEVGIVFYRIPPNVSPTAFGERTLLQPAPTDLATVKSGKVADFSPNSTACSAIASFAKSETVRQKLNTSQKIYGALPYLQFVAQLQVCQCRDGKYCHHEKNVVETTNGAVQICWHHDKLRMDGEISVDKCLMDALIKAGVIVDDAWQWLPDVHWRAMGMEKGGKVVVKIWEVA